MPETQSDSVCRALGLAPEDEIAIELSTGGGDFMFECRFDSYPEGCAD